MPREPNLSARFLATLTQTLGSEARPEEIFHYIYAVLHSPTYRGRYAEFLKIDFPRVPLTSNPDLWNALTPLGARLVALHTMKETADNPPSFPEKGDNRVEKVRHAQDRVHINKTQYFEPVPQVVWEHRIGGYQPCEKWLKDRKDRTLTYDDLTHYAAIVANLRETRRIMKQIDEVIEEHGGWPIR